MLTNNIFLFRPLGLLPSIYSAITMGKIMSENVANPIHFPFHNGFVKPLFQSHSIQSILITDSVNNEIFSSSFIAVIRNSLVVGCPLFPYKHIPVKQYTGNQ